MKRETDKSLHFLFYASYSGFLEKITDLRGFYISVQKNIMAIATIKGLPVFNAEINDEECGMKRISLVDLPAVESDFLAFAADKRPVMYAVADEEKRLVHGVVMRANFAIYRNDSYGEYYIVYKPETIRRMAEKYLAESRQNEFNTMHENGSDVDGIQMVQFYIKDSSKGVSPAGFEDIEDGSLFGEFHVTNDEVWAAIKDGTYKGFSLEGVFSCEPADKQDVNEVEGISLFRKITNFKHDNNMSIKNKVKAILRTIIAEFNAISTDKGVLVWDGDDDLKVGDAVFIESEEGERTPAEDGEYKTEEEIIVVVDGKVDAINEANEANEADEGNDAEQEQNMSEEEIIARIDALEARIVELEAKLSSMEGKVDEVEDKVDEVEDKVDEVEDSVVEIAETMHKMGKAPAATPAHEEFQQSIPKVKGDESFERILAKVKAHANRKV